MFGLDHNGERIRDEIPGYSFLVDQRIQEYGIFFQDTWSPSENWTLDAGLRINWHDRLSVPVPTPRIHLLHRSGPSSWRLSWVRGFKGPQAFDADLHIAFAGGGISRVRIDPGLRHERSNGFMVSWDRQEIHGKHLLSYTLQGFFNDLHDNFILENTGRDSLGQLILHRTNGEGATVYGLSAELSWVNGNWFECALGWTWQRSRHRSSVSWSEEGQPVNTFLRTPDHYGFLNVAFWPDGHLTPKIAAVFTGPMMVPHLAGAPGVEKDVLRRSPFFPDIQLSLSKTWDWPAGKRKLVLTGGVFNILNAFQEDFDIGPNRDSNYVYGPMRPRSFFLSMKWIQT